VLDGRGGKRLLYWTTAMPKMKTHSGAKKRFKLTGTGKVRARHSFSSHILEKKSPKRKRHMAVPVMISPHDLPRVQTLLGAKKSRKRHARPAGAKQEAGS
jgi:large subunit ribosomal protein L35